MLLGDNHRNWKLDLDHLMEIGPFEKLKPVVRFLQKEKKKLWQSFEQAAKG